MKITPVLIVIALAATAFSCADSSAERSSANEGFAVVELFTSEGCSSCPPADNAVAKLLKERSSNVYVLGYHVDYWDKYGWKDIFSSAAYTQMQREYANSFKLSSVYTPQIVVNGTEQFVGSNESRLNAAVNKDLQETSAIRLDVDAGSSGNGTVNVHYTTDAANAKLKVALIQLSAENKIQSGENTGATLHHVNIVRDVQTISVAAKGNTTLKLPRGLQAKDCHVIAFTQNTSDNKITAATEVSIQ